jgi:hypothetical protein
MNASTNGATDDDVEENEDGVKLDLNQENEKEAMSPGARTRAVSICPFHVICLPLSFSCSEYGG